MKLYRGKHLFDALIRICDHPALEPEMDEIVRAVEWDNGLGEHASGTPRPAKSKDGCEMKVEMIDGIIRSVEVDGIKFHRLSDQ